METDTCYTLGLSPTIKGLWLHTFTSTELDLLILSHTMLFIGCWSKREMKMPVKMCI